MVNKTKRVYHPLVLFFYYANLLTNEQLAQIPKTTVDYWKKNVPVEMHGYAWVASFANDYANFQKVEKHKIIYKVARIACKIIDSLTIILGTTKGYKSALKNNMALVTSTIDSLSPQLPFHFVCKAYKISTQQYYRWKNKVHCTASVFNLCYKTHPQQLSFAETDIIKKEINKPENLFKKMSTIWYGLMRAGLLYCSASTFYKYAKPLSERPVIKKPVKPKQSVKALRIFEYIHIDTTFLNTITDGSVRAVVLKDNYSKKILHSGIVKNGASMWVAELIKEMFNLYGLYQYEKTITLVTDGGSENKGEVDVWVEQMNEVMDVCKQTARSSSFVFTNNEIESCFNIFKNEFLINKEILDTCHAKKLLTDFVFYFNNERYPTVLYGLTAQEVFDGEIIDKHRFTQQIKEAKNERVLINATQSNCKVCLR